MHFLCCLAIAAASLNGLWEATLRFGPDLRGPLTIARDTGGWRGEIGGRSAAITVKGDEVTFALPQDEGAFAGHFDKARGRIVGHWIQARAMTSGNRFASPVTLVKAGDNVWRGDVAPLDDDFRFYLHLAMRADGTFEAYLRNPERNLQRWLRVDSAKLDGAKLRLFSGDKVVAEGVVDEEGTLAVPLNGNTYDFHRVESSDFYPRRAPGAAYVYRPPRARDDGWAVASVDDVGISREGIERFIRMLIDTPIDSAGAVETHAVLIARHGKLVVEEYFHGEHAGKLHDSRSAAKSLTATLAGAAIAHGAPLAVSDRVYAVMNGGALPAGLEPRKQAMTLEHLLTMTSGFYCDDGDPKAPGNEENILDQSAERDYYKLALNLPMESDPGTHSVYCSIQPHLAGGVLQRAAGKPLPDLFRELVAEPMQMRRYALPLAPSGDAYMGGGVRFLPRDMIKLAQMMMDGGTWKGRRIVSADFAKRATSPLHLLDKRGYGYLWYADDIQYHGRVVKSFMAGGNGGQVALAIPELDLVVGFWGGNYSTKNTYVSQNVYMPQYILPAVGEK